MPPSSDERMAYHDERYSERSSIRARVYDASPARIVVLTEDRGNTGASVTNTVEMAYRLARTRWPGVRVVEHYPKRAAAGPEEQATLDEVLLNEHGAPSWRRLSVAELVELVGYDDAEALLQESA